MSLLRRKIALLRTLHRIGWRRVLLVAQHRRRMRSGYYVRACPAGDWPEVDTGRSPFSPGSGGSGKRDADRIVDGELCYFSWKWLPKPPTWRENPSSGFQTDLSHWSTFRDFDERQGDVKWIWEPSRFDWAVTLARAYAVAGEEKYRDRFSELLDDWRSNNPPNQGINWFCAQECSLRMLALIFAAGVFSTYPRMGHATDRGEGGEDLWSTVAALAERVEPSLGYAIGQHNNHGISEAMGLFLAGMCLPKHPSAPRWREVGKRLLCRSILEQFAPDGSYVQHSFIYQRLAMRCCLACFHTARVFGDSFPKEVEERVLQSARFLYEMMVVRSPSPPDGERGLGGEGLGARTGTTQQSAHEPPLTPAHEPSPTLSPAGGEGGPEPGGAGRLPNYGANDGANALCLSDCDYLDFRPIIQLAFAVLSGQRAFGEGPWDEELGWYGIDVSALSSYDPPASSDFGATEGGYYVLRSDPGRDADSTGSATYAFMRVPRYTDGRPSQADALHVDVWIDGEPVAVDSGTYSYNDPDGWWKHFKSTAAHNTVVVDKGDQMPSVGRFLFTDWTRAKLCEHALGSILATTRAHTHMGFASSHERQLELRKDSTLVADTISARSVFILEVNWHLEGAWKVAKVAAPASTFWWQFLTSERLGLFMSCERPCELFLEGRMAPHTLQSEMYGFTRPVTLVNAHVPGTSPVTVFSAFVRLDASGSVDLSGLPLWTALEREPIGVR